MTTERKNEGQCNAEEDRHEVTSNPRKLTQSMRMTAACERFGLKPKFTGGSLAVNVCFLCYEAYNTDMPELSRFFGIIIRMYAEANISHHLPHFHAYYQEHVAIYTIDPVELIAGSLPQRQQRLVEAWAELHQTDLLANWQQLQEGRKPHPIEPLK